MFKLAHDPDVEVRQNVCQALVLLLEVSLTSLLPHLPGIIEVCVTIQ